MGMHIKHFYAPTPKKWRQIGDALLGTATFMVSGGLFGFDYLKDIFGADLLKVIIGVTFVVGVLGKFLTNFFKEDPV